MECIADKPNALSWDISVSDGAMFGGFYMEGAIHRWMITRQPEDRERARRYAPAILEAIRHYRHERLYISQFLPAESAYYRLGLSGVV